MTTIAIQDLQKASSITELKDRELNVINGGIEPVTLAVTTAAVAGFFVGWKTGVRLYDATFNDP